MSSDQGSNKLPKAPETPSNSSTKPSSNPAANSAVSETLTSMRNLKRTELSFRAFVNDTFLRKLNYLVGEREKSLVRGLKECYKEDKSWEEVSKCQKVEEEKFVKGQESVQYLLKACQEQLYTCLTSCKTDLSQDVPFCYQSCIKGMEGTLKGV